MALVVFTGGARSGKSAAAQRLAAQRAAQGGRVVVAVFGRPDASDAEFAARIERHRHERPSTFVTLEAERVRGWLSIVDEDDVLVVDCLGTLLGLLMSEMLDLEGTARVAAEQDGVGTGPDGSHGQAAHGVERAFVEQVEAVIGRRGDTIVVTNEVGSGVVPAYPSGRLFRDLLGRANRMLVAAADAAYLCVAGRLVDLCALPSECRWPED